MNIKGTTIAFIPEYIKEKHGEKALQDWLDQLPPESKKIFSARILASSWYPLNDGMKIPMKALCDRFYGGNVEGSIDIGRYSADYGLRGIYKIFVKMGSPESLAKRATSVFPNYYEGLSMEVIKAEPGHAHLRITQFPDVDSYVENRILGYMLRAVELSGGTDAIGTMPSRISKGEKFTDYDVHWK